MDNSAKVLDVLLKISNSLEEIKSAVSGKDVSKPAPAPKEEPVKSAAVKKEEPASTGAADDFSWYDQFVKDYVVPAINASNNLGEQFTPIGEIFDILFAKLLREILIKAAHCRKPTDEEMPSLFAPVKDCNEKLQTLDKDRNFPVNYVKALREIVNSIFWVNVNEKPDSMITESLNSATFWIDRIRREAKNKMETKPMEWAKLVIAMMKQLSSLVAQRFENGLQWNPSGESPASFNASAATPAPAPAPAPAAPVEEAKEAKGGKASLASELEKMVGANGVKNLRHVEKSEMSHKNPALRGNVKMEKKAETVVMTKPPRCELVQNRWFIENQTGNVEVEVKFIHTVYVTNCVGANVVVKGKAKTVIMDNCKKTSLIFDKCLSTLEIVNCKQVKVQCLTDIPVVAVDKTDSFMLYLPRECVEKVKITTSKSSDMNVSFPSATDPEDWIERAIPEQYVHTISNDVLNTTVSDLYH